MARIIGSDTAEFAGDSFQLTVVALFEALDVPSGPEDVWQAKSALTVDNTVVELDNTEDATAIRCSTFAGTVSADPRWRSRQLGDVLKRNLALVPRYRICVSLETAEDKSHRIKLSFAAAYQGLGISELVEQISDLVFLAESYRDMLDEPVPGTRPSNDTRGPEPGAEPVIFRP